MISRTEPLAFDDVAFIDATETNYIAAMDEQLGIHQTRMSVVEYAGNVDPTALTETALSELIGESGSSFLTRLHTRISAAALRAETQAQGIIALRDDPAGDYSRDHQVASSGCSEPEPMEDAGPAEPMADGACWRWMGGPPIVRSSHAPTAVLTKRAIQEGATADAQRFSVTRRFQ